METENLEEQEKCPEYPSKTDTQRHIYRRGIFSGVVGTLAVLAVLVITAGVTLHFKSGQRTANEQMQAGISGKNARETISSQAVEQKAGEIADLIDEYYYEEIDQDALVDGMYAGMVNGLGDKYSTYMTAEEYSSFNDTTTGTYYGIGAVLTQDPDTNIVTILHVYPGSPAEEAGVRDGDIIVKVEEIEGDSMELSELVKHIKGEEGTSVHLLLMREGESDYLEFDVQRREIDVPTVEYEMLEGTNVGLIAISEFAENTPEQFDAAIKDLQKQGMESVVIDLRDNPGGVLQSVCKMLDQILPEGLVVYTEDKYGNRSDFQSDASCMDIPLAVLVNENSASASEIFAGAIKDYKYGTLIGTTTFGKGIVQTIIPLDDKSAVKLTMAKYYTPNGNYIHGVGITPDIELEYEYQSPEDTVYDPMHDNQVLKAIEVLKKEQ